jgi:magnesium-transporting ATPase (P-type)
MMDQLQHEQYEYARKRINQKKRLYLHAVLFLLGSVFFIVLNKAFNFGEDIFKNWFVWAVVAWLFILMLNVINVFVVNRFMGKEWQRKQTERLILKQEVKIANMEKEIERKARLAAENKVPAKSIQENSKEESSEDQYDKSDNS